MTYENFRVGLTRLFIFLTILIEMVMFFYNYTAGPSTFYYLSISKVKLENIFSDFFTTRYNHVRFDTIDAMMTTPFLMVGLFYICCWIVKGFYFGKGNQKI